MGCGASSSAAAVPPQPNNAAPLPAEARAVPATTERPEPAAELRSCWVSVAGGKAGATLSEQQVRGVLTELGKHLSDKEFAEAFKAMDTNGSGVIEFPEFVEFYKASTAAEQKKIRALKAQEELLRRLNSGMLTADEERLVRQRLALPPPATEQVMQKVSEQKKMTVAANELDPDPADPLGRMVVLELKGGNDKQKKGAGEGHRRDTFPICNAVKNRGWECKVVVYSAADHGAVAAMCESADGVIVRAAQGEPGVFGEAGPGILYDLLESLADRYVACRISVSQSEDCINFRADSGGLP